MNTQSLEVGVPGSWVPKTGPGALSLARYPCPPELNRVRGMEKVALGQGKGFSDSLKGITQPEEGQPPLCVWGPQPRLLCWTQP